MNNQNWYCFESIWEEPETWLKHEFWITSLRWNWDIVLEMHNWKGSRTSNAEIRFYSQFWWQIALNTYGALSQILSILSWEKLDLPKRNFSEKVQILNQQWEFTVEYDKVARKVVLTVRQLIDDNARECDNKASIAFVAEGKKDRTWELVITVKDAVFRCFAHLQHEMKKDRKEDRRIYE
ncbi:MAG: hypothetical protein ACD_2C00033G0009 [uncultured bacterium (gcode 4)]|uniref:Uncharacterized protein n=1 Tax=uncultured bacterium (gcode 4) TaxID=1234023 RepID=K2G4L5_9BACT|nr:MAG: hypothetical protein ACD_2C00033G0009 [uncultured bacterium (gcode 4)]